jgi:hypothetical protein
VRVWMRVKTGVRKTGLRKSWVYKAGLSETGLSLVAVVWGVVARGKSRGISKLSLRRVICRCRLLEVLRLLGQRLLLMPGGMWVRIGGMPPLRSCRLRQSLLRHGLMWRMRGRRCHLTIVAV